MDRNELEKKVGSYGLDVLWSKFDNATDYYDFIDTHTYEEIKDKMVYGKDGENATLHNGEIVW